MSTVREIIIHRLRQCPQLHRVVWKTRTWFYKIMHWIVVRKTVHADAMNLVDAIRYAKPYAIGKIGSVEALAIARYIQRIKSHGKKPDYPPYTYKTLYANAGVFPPTEQMFDNFGVIFSRAITACDSLVAWYVAGEATIFKNLCAETSFIQMRTLESYFFANPWTAFLEGKRVLVVSPFVDTIKQQYEKREKVWPNRCVLPAFKLLTLKAPLSAAIVPPKAKDWTEALNEMLLHLDEVEFDVLLVGAGAYSLPLVAHAKHLGKVGVHLGGSLQVLFGILGQRWADHADFKPFFNEYWCRPSSDETPDKRDVIENGCYW